MTLTRFPSAFWWTAFIVWTATSLILISSSLDDVLTVVPMRFHDMILWPNAMTLGSFFAVSSLLAVRRAPKVPEFVAATFAGSVIGVASLLATTEFEALFCGLSTLALFVMVARCAASRRSPGAAQAMALAIYVLYGGSVYAGHTMFLFPVFEEINVQRSATAAAIVSGDVPLSDPACQTVHVSCFAFDPEGDRRGFSELYWSYLADVDRNRPAETVSLELSTYDALNHKTDSAFVAMRHVDGQSAVAVSLSGHLMEWRVLAAKYFIASSSFTFLFLYATLLPLGLWLQRRVDTGVNGR